MGLLHYLWSRTANNNSTADAQVNWAEGMAPSAVNDSARAMMASLAGYRDDIAGAITTGGTSTAYTVTSYQVFDTLAHMSGQVIAFTPHTTNGATVTLNVDGLGAKPLRSAPSVELPAGVLIQGTPYTALYNNSDAVWYLHNFYVNPYATPIGGGMPYIGTTAPNSAFVFPYGQAVSRTTYSTLFGMISTTYGTGDGSTTFNLPDWRGRVLAGKDDMGGSAASRLTSTYFGTSAATLGATGGSESNTLSLAKLPTGITSTGTVTVGTNAKVIPIATGTVSTQPSPSTGGNQVPTSTVSWTSILDNFTGANTLTSNNTSGEAHANVQPTAICNYIIRII